MSRNNNRFIRDKKHGNILLLLVIILSITVGYALVSTTLDVHGIIDVKKNTWNISFGTITPNSGSITPDSAPTITNGKLSYEVTLKAPGDYYEFDVVVTNSGTVNAKLSDLPTLDGLTAAQDVYINHTIAHADGTPIVEGEKLAKNGGTQTFRVRVEFDENIEEEDFPTTDQTMRLTASIPYIQD